jgi:ammonium transporter, Amt family
MEQLQNSSDVFFLLIGAILVFAMHGGFAFLEVGTVRHKNQVNALVKILVDFAISSAIRSPTEFRSWSARRT